MDTDKLLKSLLQKPWFDTCFMRAFGWWKIPLLAYVRPRVVAVGDKEFRMMIPLRRRTKNHLGSMYMGALMIGADVAAAYYAAKLIFLSGQKIDFVFKSAEGRFLKRPTGDVEFICSDGALIQDLLTRAMNSSERVEAALKVIAKVPSESQELVAEMTMVLSLKNRSKKG